MTTITPSMLMGDLPARLPNAYRATTTGEALQLINAGLIAVLPAGAWDIAEDVLRVVDSDHAHILQLLHLARTGESRRVQCDCPSCLAGLTRPRRRPDGSLIWYDEPSDALPEAPADAGATPHAMETFKARSPRP
jgi:hypothetical protein